MAVAKTELEMKLLATLQMIARYDDPERLRRTAEKRYGLTGDEALEMAYENVLSHARTAVRGHRLGRS
jgi:hypothetical protein